MKNVELISYVRAAGGLLYGERWQTELSSQLGLKDARRMRQWLSGDRPFPQGIEKEITDLLVKRKEAIQRFLDGEGEE